MQQAAAELNFEEAAILRDRMLEIEGIPAIKSRAAICFHRMKTGNIKIRRKSHERASNILRSGERTSIT